MKHILLSVLVLAISFTAVSCRLVRSSSKKEGGIKNSDYLIRLEAENRKIKDKFAEIEFLNRQTRFQEPARVKLETNSQKHDNNESFWNWLCRVVTGAARGVLSFFGIHF